MKINSSKEFGEFLRARRTELGYTQSYLSELTGLSISFISDVENGKKTVELNRSIDLLSMLGIDLILEKRR